MAAGLGFKDFTTGEVLTAADVDGYLMQGIWVFASNAARDAAVTAPAEGNFAFTKDTNSLWYYDGAAWVASGATGDIEGVTAGVGISGGGTSGTVTVTNSMATAIDAKGDLIVGTGADTFARLAVGGTNGHILTVDSGEATGVKWAAAAGGGSLTQLGTTTTLSGASTTVSFTATGYKNLYVQIDSVDGNGDTKLDVEPNATNNLVDVVSQRAISGLYLSEFAFDSYIRLIRDKVDGTDTQNAFSLLIYDVASTTAYKTFTAVGGYKDDSFRRSVETMGGIIKTTSAISSLKFQGSGSGYSGGTVKVYGVN
jgi:hypothetical protein